MKQFTAEEIQNQFDKLPKELQIAITSPQVNEAVEAVAEKHDLRVDQLGELVDLIGLVMLGLIPPKDFVMNFKEEAGINEDLAHAIAEDINNEVFRKIRTSMQDHREEPVEKAEMKVPEPIVPAPIQKPQEPIIPTSIQKQTEPVVIQAQKIPEQVPVQVEHPTNQIQTENINKLAYTFDTPNQSPKPSHITALEKAGGFTIEHEPVHSGDHSGMILIDSIGKRTLPSNTPIPPKPPAQEQAVIPDQPLKKEISSIITAPVQNIVPVQEEVLMITPPSIPTPIIEKPNVIPEKKVVMPPITPITPITQPVKISSNAFDMYREPIV